MAIGLLALQAHADDYRTAIHEVARYEGVPQDIFYAMALAESGRKLDGMYRVWPWSLNLEGEAKYYDDRRQMFRALMQALGEGSQSIDVGPMQINWFWQYEHIDSPWRLTEPVENLKLAAKLFKTQYALCGDWWEAVGRYHRPSQAPANIAVARAYRDRVRALYAKVSDEGEPRAN